MVLCHWNPNCITNKEPIFKRFLLKNSVNLAGISESKTFKNPHLSDVKWIWDPGIENRPTPIQNKPKGGIGVFADRSIPYSVVHTDPNFMWIRISTQDGHPIFIAECYFPHSSNTKSHKMIWNRLHDMIKDYMRTGFVIIMGDFNAHTAVENTDTAGRILLSNIESLDLLLLNRTQICHGSSTRSIEYANGESSSSMIDYVIISKPLAPFVQKMEIVEDRMGSDHNPILITLHGLLFSQKRSSPLREVWRIENIPTDTDSPAYRNFTLSYKVAFEEWEKHTRNHILALQATEVDNARIADLVEWSFQQCLDEVSQTQIGKKKIGPSSIPQMTKAVRILNDHRLFCEHALKKTMTSPNSSDQDRMKAISLHRMARSNCVRAMATQRDILELQTFLQIEEHQGDSKLFWAHAKKISNNLRDFIRPPPMAHHPTEEECQTDPVAILKIWRSFGESVSNPGDSEEGNYDDNYKRHVDNRLQCLRKTQNYQQGLDAPITRAEIFRALRKIKTGKAPGVDGILTSILKPAADAVGTNDVDDYNPVVDSLKLLFNFILTNEVWPSRWAEGIIFPLYKNTGSRLDPSNYRPITLLSTVGKLFGSIIENRLSTWSENEATLADEQGGFRRGRGTSDLIFLLREIILNRKAHRLPTLVTFIDVKKAYDTVWREGNYVRLYDLGVRGKLWRQLQVMNSDPKSKYRLPFGETEWFKISRGVAQGAVESPWLYSCFINGLAEDLKASNLGIRIAGKHTPLLMYADDIVLLAGSVYELRAMNDIVSEFAFKNRYKLNGDKSAIMAFNADTSTLTQVHAETWMLSGQKVEVKQSYKYLGTETLTSLDWTQHVTRAITKAKSLSEDLSWICRREGGLRPRSAATLWKAIARPVIEYAAELWSGEIPTTLVDQAEAVQVSFACSILGLSRCQSISHDIIRSEMGMEKLSSRWEKLRLGFWRRIQVAHPDRTFTAVSAFRWDQCEHGPDNTNNGWMKHTKRLLEQRGLLIYWRFPFLCKDISKKDWKNITYESIETVEENRRHSNISHSTSTTSQNYLRIKSWGPRLPDLARFRGEVGRRGCLVHEPYLDDRSEKVGTLLKLMCRTGCLPVLKRVIREEGLHKDSAACKLCDEGVVESISHFVLHCKAHLDHRLKFFRSLEDFLNLDLLDDDSKLALLLGASTGDASADQRIDFLVKRYLKKAWRKRKWLTRAINQLFDRHDTVWALKCQEDYQALEI